MPGIHHNLISVSQLCHQNNVSIEFFPSCFKVKTLDTGKTLLQGSNDNHIYKIQSFNNPQVHNVIHSKISWHHRLGHPTPRILQQIISTHRLPLSNSEPFSCTDCLQNKSHRLPFYHSSISTSQPLDVIYADVWGPTPFTSIKGFRFYVIFIDHFSKYVWFYPLKRKSNVSVIFPQFKNLVEKQFDLSLKTLFIDNGGKFLKLKPFLINHGISHCTTPPHTPEHNGLTERKHRHLVETARCLLNHANVPKQF